ncbi:MAG TPA: AbrB/MazE/SpoVT family DNA-binding domain-containing protein [Candidatus Manganitrophaceae bacterium]|nr:AbrB/MazE/SpoVT family DNA-binding domain-containing protein [Candidatus Manganitrophaceae bacterium]
MALVRVKDKFQITLPAALREQVHLSVGDVVEIKVEGTKIVLTPQALIERELAEALEDIRKGRTLGPFKNSKEAVRALRRAAKPPSHGTKKR